MKKIACLVLIVSICVGSMMSYRAHSSVLVQYSSFGGVASVSTWSGASIMTLVNYIAQLAAAAGIVAENNRTVNIVVPPLPFPNPFSLTRVMDSKFGQTGAVIGFTSDKVIQGDIKVLIYDMFGNQVMHRNYTEDDTQNRETRSINGNQFTQLTINKHMLNYEAPSGVYLYVVQADDKRIGKGKMLIVP